MKYWMDNPPRRQLDNLRLTLKSDYQTTDRKTDMRIKKMPSCVKYLKNTSKIKRTAITVREGYSPC
jgi:hypothetical protein